MSTFPEFLRDQIERIGQGNKRVGELRIAIALGVTDRTVRLWSIDNSKPPAAGMIAGAQLLLPQISTVSKEAIAHLLAPSPQRKRKAAHAAG